MGFTFSVGVKTKFGTSGPEITETVGITISAKDDIIGQSAVFYCDDADNDGTAYTTGSMVFHIKEKE